MSDSVDIALGMLKKGQHLNADHPLVVIEDEIARLRERIAELEALLNQRTKERNEAARYFAEAEMALQELDDESKGILETPAATEQGASSNASVPVSERQL